MEGICIGFPQSSFMENYFQTRMQFVSILYFFWWSHLLTIAIGKIRTQGALQGKKLHLVEKMHPSIHLLGVIYKSNLMVIQSSRIYLSNKCFLAVKSIVRKRGRGANKRRDHRASFSLFLQHFLLLVMMPKCPRCPQGILPVQIGRLLE